MTRWMHYDNTFYSLAEAEKKCRKIREAGEHKHVRFIARHLHRLEPKDGSLTPVTYYRVQYRANPTAPKGHPHTWRRLVEHEHWICTGCRKVTVSRFSPAEDATPTGRTIRKSRVDGWGRSITGGKKP